MLPFAFPSRSEPWDSRQLCAIFQFFIWWTVISLLLAGNNSLWKTYKDAAEPFEFLHSRESCLWILLELQFSTHELCTWACVRVSLSLLSWEFPGNPFFHGVKILQSGETLTAGFQIFIREQSHHFFSALSTVWNSLLSTQITKWTTLVQHPRLPNEI